MREPLIHVGCQEALLDRIVPDFLDDACSILWRHRCINLKNIRVALKPSVHSINLQVHEYLLRGLLAHFFPRLKKSYSFVCSGSGVNLARWPSSVSTCGRGFLPPRD